MHDNLAEEINLVYGPSGLEITDLCVEPESQTYGACSFALGLAKVRYRAARVTPKKIGQFVTLWKRVGSNPIQAYSIEDLDELFVVSVRTDTEHGQFIFPRDTLFEKGILADESTRGKTAFRVYPPWDIPNNRQAKSSQEWQLEFFLDLSSEAQIDRQRLKKLYELAYD